jgi:hypothetical protein
VLVEVAGDLRLRVKPTPQLAVFFERALADYYLSLLPRWWDVKGQRYDPHLTVVRFGKEEPSDPAWWRLVDRGNIPVVYDSELRCGGSYFWLDAWSDGVGAIRRRLGLSRYRAGFDRYHITVGNRK